MSVLLYAMGRWKHYWIFFFPPQQWVKMKNSKTQTPCMYNLPQNKVREKKWMALFTTFIYRMVLHMFMFIFILFVNMGKHFFHWPWFSIVFDDAVGCTPSSKNILVKIEKEFKTLKWYQPSTCWCLRVCLDAGKWRENRSSSIKT